MVSAPLNPHVAGITPFKRCFHPELLFIAVQLMALVYRLNREIGQ